MPLGYGGAHVNGDGTGIYLLHGFANDHHSWHRYGRANDILDNLRAEGGAAHVTDPVVCHGSADLVATPDRGCDVSSRT